MLHGSFVIRNEVGPRRFRVADACIRTLAAKCVRLPV